MAVPPSASDARSCRGRGSIRSTVPRIGPAPSTTVGRIPTVSARIGQVQISRQCDLTQRGSAWVYARALEVRWNMFMAGSR